MNARKKYNKIYNKLYLSELQDLYCGPIGIYPKKYPIIIKPIINLYGMSNKFIKINNFEEYIEKEKDYIGMFWQKYLPGDQYNIDINMKNGKIIQYYTVKSIPDNKGMFKYHYYYSKYRLSKKIIIFLETILKNYTGFLNIEVINNYIIEIHLRLNGDLFLYTKKNIDRMIERKRTIIKNKCFFPIFIQKELNIDIKDYLDNLNIIYELDNSICNNYKRYCYFTHTNLIEGINIKQKIDEYIQKL